MYRGIIRRGVGVENPSLDPTEAARNRFKSTLVDERRQVKGGKGTIEVIRGELRKTKFRNKAIKTFAYFTTRVYCLSSKKPVLQRLRILK